MRRFYILSIATLLIVTIFASCNKPQRYTLIVENASIFDTKTGNVVTGKTILINADTIVGIVDAGEPVRTKKVVDAEGRLVVPGNIDASMHLDDAFVDVKADVAETHPKSLTSFYRNKFTKQFLPYGITLALDMGQVEAWQRQTNEWHSHPMFTELLTASKIEIGDIKTSIPEKVDNLHGMGIRYVYAGPSFDVEAIKQLTDAANAHGMVVFVSPSYNVEFEGGLRNIEGISDLLINIVKKFGNEGAFKVLVGNVFDGCNNLSEHIVALEAFNYLFTAVPSALDSVSSMFGKQQVSITSSLHLMAEAGGLLSNKHTSDSAVPFTNEQKLRIEYNFNHLLSYVRQLYGSGVRFRIGSNSPNGGRAFIEEQIILAKAGIPVADIIQMSSLGTAQVLHIDNFYGSVEVGKKADLIIYEQNPLDDYRFFETPRRVIKNGKLYRRNSRNVELEEIK